MEFLYKTKAPGERARLLAAFEKFVRENHIPPEVSKAADLAIEEHLTNILSYGFFDQDEHTVGLKLAFEAGELKVEMSDDGRPFDPTAYPAPDFKPPADERSIGGLGIHMIRQSMDAIDYERRDGRNILRMRKRFKG